MPLRYASDNPRATLLRTIQLWLLSNAGGTLWLLGYFAADRLDDYPIALLTGMLAAMVSLAVVPLVIPFFAVMCRFCAGWTRCYVALLGVVLFFLLANELLLLLLPVGSVLSLLELSLHYLGAALLTVGWLYGPARRTSSPPQSAP